MSDIIASTYQIIERIGSGGGGVVYLANHLRLNKRVVLKADKRKLSARPEVLRREVDVLKNLSHTYIPQVYDFFNEGENVYTVMDYIEGESLDRPLKRGERFEQAVVIKWAIELLEALSYLHSPTHGDPPKGIVHSDIKPANIMRTPGGDICLIDFNIALALGEENVVGRSEGYSSPEHYGIDYSVSSSESGFAGDGETEKIGRTQTGTAAGDGEATEVMEGISDGVSSKRTFSSSKRLIIPDARSDIYSVGATLYHLITGVKPNKEAVAVTPVPKGMASPQIIKIISKAMNPNPDLRYQTAEEMLFEIKNLRKNDIRSRRFRNANIAAAAVLSSVFAIGALCAFTGVKRMENVQASAAMAGRSAQALVNGDRRGAIEYALSSLDTEKGIFSASYTAEGQNALTDALGVYDVSDGYKLYANTYLSSQTVKTAMSSDGKTAAAVYAFGAIVTDTESGSVIAQLPTVRSAYADIEFLNNSSLVYAAEDGIKAYDIKNKKELWRGAMATEAAVSADGGTVAAVYKNESKAYIYSSDGAFKKEISFGERRQNILENDTFANPGNHLFGLSADGSLLAVSFEGGALILFDTNTGEEYIELFDASDYTHFEGGFYRNYFAFSATSENGSVFAVIDTASAEQTGGFSSEHRFGVRANETGIYVSNEDVLVKLHPVTGEQKELAYTNSDIRTFDTDGTVSAVITEDNRYMFFDGDANKISEYSDETDICDFVNAAGEYAVLGSRSTPVLKILKRKSYIDADIMRYDSTYKHDEARISADGKSIMLYDYEKIRIYSSDGSLIKEVSIPDAMNVYDQQYSKKSGNLAVMYKDALRIYSGKTGDIVFEESGLKNVFYAHYGISILSRDGTLRLIDADSGEAVFTGSSDGNFALYCGTVADDKLTDGARPVGAARLSGGEYVFAAQNGNSVKIYDGSGKMMFEVSSGENTEVFFTDNAAVVSPLHGAPSVYSLKNGKKITELEKDAYLTYITQTDNYIISEYISTDGQRYGIMLDKDTYKPVARMPQLCDIQNKEAIFDCRTGILRKTRIYSINELINLAKEGVV